MIINQTAHPDRTGHMRIILKPGGIALILASLGTLVALTYLSTGKQSKQAAVAAAMPVKSVATHPDRSDTQAPSPPAISTQSAGGDTSQLLVESSFEGTAVPIITDVKNDRARIGGESSEEWIDNSGWAFIDLDYSLAAGQGHSGGSCQKIEIRRLGDKAAACQFARIVTLKPGNYHATAWVRSGSAVSSLPVTFGLRQLGGSYTNKVVTVAAGTAWTKVDVVTAIDPGGRVFLFFSCQKPGVLFIDAVRLESVR